MEVRLPGNVCDTAVVCNTVAVCEVFSLVAGEKNVVNSPLLLREMTPALLGGIVNTTGPPVSRSVTTVDVVCAGTTVEVITVFD